MEMLIKLKRFLEAGMVSSNEANVSQERDAILWKRK